MVERARPDDDRGRDGGSTRGKWSYVPQKAEDIRARATSKGGRFDSIFKSGFDTWRAKGGDNLIRFLPGTWNLGVPYAYDIWVHRYVGADDSTYLCINKMLGKFCPMCDAAAEAKRAKDEEEQRALRAVEQRVAWILDRKGDMPMQPLLFQMSRTLDSSILTLTSIKEQLWIDNPTKGYDVSLQRSGTGLNTRYIAAIDREPSPIADKDRDFEKIIAYINDNPIPDLLKYYDAEHLERVISGTSGPREDREEAAPSRGRERDRDRDEPVRASREPEPEREERPRRAREEPREEPEERERPSRRAARDEAKDEEDEDRGGRSRREPDDAPSDRARAGNGGDEDDPPFDDSRPRRAETDEPRGGRRGSEDDEDRRPRRR